MISVDLRDHPDVDPHHVITMLKGFAIRIEDCSRGSFSGEAAHQSLAAINEEARKTLALLDRPDLLIYLPVAAAAHKADTERILSTLRDEANT